MVYGNRWIIAAALASILASACGTQPATKPPPGKADGGPSEVIPEPDAGNPPTQHPDAGGVVQARMLSVVGDPAPSVQFGSTVQLTALLVGTGVGSIANAQVSFTVSGDGQLSSATATTNAAGLATVNFTAPNTASTAEITASADMVSQQNEANWLISIVQPSRQLLMESSGSVVVTSRLPAKLMVKLQDNDKGTAIAGGKVTFSVASGSRSGVQLNGKSQDTDVETTGVDGMARVTLSAASVADEFGFTLQASEPYSNVLLFTVDVQPLADTSCGTDSDCSSGYSCQQGQCEPKPECSTSSDCNGGFTCQQGQCVCSAATQCPTGQHCDTTLGQCVTGCTTDSDCTGTRVCDLSQGICVYPSQLTCTTSADCPTDYNCQSGHCVPNTSSSTTCTSSADCPINEYCNTSINKCITGCDDSSQCDSGMVCDPASHQCVSGCQQDTDCFPQVCDTTTGQCVDAPPVIYDVSGDWKAVQIFHVKNLLPASIQSGLAAVDTAFGYLEAVVDCHVSQYVPGWALTACDLLAGEDCGQAIDDAVCQAISQYVPSWVTTVVHIGADVGKVINDFEVHSDMTIQQPGTGQTDKHKISGVDDWQTAVFYWYTDDCPTPAPGDPPPQCALVELDITTADVHPAPSQFTGTVQDSTLNIDTHNINLAFGKLVVLLIDTILQDETGYSDIQSAIEGAVDCSAINSWIEGVVDGILGQSVPIDLTGTCQSALSAAAKAAVNAISGLNADLPMSLSGKAGIVLLPGNTSNQADRLAPGVWYTKFPNSGETLEEVGEWYADRP